MTELLLKDLLLFPPSHFSALPSPVHMEREWEQPLLRNRQLLHPAPPEKYHGQLAGISIPEIVGKEPDRPWNCLKSWSWWLCLFYFRWWFQALGTSVNQKDNQIPLALKESIFNLIGCPCERKHIFMWEHIPLSQTPLNPIPVEESDPQGRSQLN